MMHSKIVKRSLFAVLVLVIVIATVYIRRFSPIYIKVDNLEKVIESGDDSKQTLFYCQKFEMTPAQFRQYFIDARPIFDIEIHDYDWLPCYYKANVGNKEYRVRLGGIGEVIQGEDIQSYAKKEDITIHAN